MLLWCPRAQPYIDKVCKPVKDAMLAEKMQKKGDLCGSKDLRLSALQRSAAGDSGLPHSAGALLSFFLFPGLVDKF